MTTSPIHLLLSWPNDTEPFLAIYSTSQRCGSDAASLLPWSTVSSSHSREAAGLLPYLISSRNETEETPFSDKHHWMLDANIACGADKGPIDAAEDQRNHFYSRKKKSFFEGKTFLVR